jgi:hypothetical protein
MFISSPPEISEICLRWPTCALACIAICGDVLYAMFACIEFTAYVPECAGCVGCGECVGCVGCAEWPWTACMYSSGTLLVTGETPVIWFGEFQLLAVAGDLAGDSSSFNTCLVAANGCGATMPSTCAIGFFKCARCFSSICRRPSFVNGLGSTSFMPKKIRKQVRAHARWATYHVGNTWKYRHF